MSKRSLDQLLTDLGVPGIGSAGGAVDTPDYRAKRARTAPALGGGVFPEGPDTSTYPSVGSIASVLAPEATHDAGTTTAAGFPIGQRYTIMRVPSKFAVAPPFAPKGHYLFAFAGTAGGHGTTTLFTPPMLNDQFATYEAAACATKVLNAAGAQIGNRVLHKPPAVIAAALRQVGVLLMEPTAAPITGDTSHPYGVLSHSRGMFAGGDFASTAIVARSISAEGWAGDDGMIDYWSERSTYIGRELWMAIIIVATPTRHVWRLVPVTVEDRGVNSVRGTAAGRPQHGLRLRVPAIVHPAPVGGVLPLEDYDAQWYTPAYLRIGRVNHVQRGQRMGRNPCVDPTAVPHIFAELGTAGARAWA